MDTGQSPRTASARTVEALSFGVLGPVEVRRGGAPLPLGGSKQRSLMAMLVLHANQVVTMQQLIEGLWADDPPASAQKMVQIYVSRLRAALDRPGAESPLVTRPPGYLLRVEPDGTDLDRFRRLVGQARALQGDDPGRAAARFREALTLFRGAPLSDVAGEPFAAAEIGRLDEERLSALEECLDGDLAAGRHAQVLAELTDLVTREPLRERFCGQLMLALYRCGRQGDALALYRQTRDTLRDELGIDPSPALQRLEMAILRQDAGLELPPATEAVMLRPSVATTPSHAAPAGWRRPGRLGALAGAVILAAAVTLTTFLLRHDAGDPAVAANSIAILDARSGTVTGDIAVGTEPGPVAVEGGNLWVGNLGDRTISRVDLARSRVVKTFGVSAEPVSLAAAGGMVWIGNGFSGTLSRILVDYDQLSAPFFPGGPVAGVIAVAATDQQLWVGLADGTLRRLEPSSLRTISVVPLHLHARTIALVNGAVWVIGFSGNQVQRIDPGQAAVSATVPLANPPLAMAAGFGSVWVATGGDDRLWRIDARSGQIAATVPLGMTPGQLAVTADAVWVTGGSDGTVERVDPASDDLVRTLRLGHAIGGVASDADHLWLTVR